MNNVVLHPVNNVVLHLVNNVVLYLVNNVVLHLVNNVVLHPVNNGVLHPVNNVLHLVIYLILLRTSFKVLEAIIGTQISFTKNVSISSRHSTGE